MTKPSVEFFKAEDFYHIAEEGSEHLCATTANRILAERGVRVYGYQTDRGSEWDEKDGPLATDTALVVDIKPIERTADEILKDLLDSVGNNPAYDCIERSDLRRIVSLAKRLLERKP